MEQKMGTARKFQLTQAEIEIRPKELLKMWRALTRRETTIATPIRSDCVGFKAFLRIPIQANSNLSISSCSLPFLIVFRGGMADYKELCSTS